MQPFAQAVSSWHDFYVMAGTAAATLLGLLFVSLSLNLEIISRTESKSLRALATRSFANFLYVLFFAITFLVPDQSPFGIGIPLLLMGTIGFLTNVLTLVAIPRDRVPLWGMTYTFWRLGLPLVAFLLLITISLFALKGDTTMLYWMIAVIVLLLLNAAQNSWDLLMRVHPQVGGSQMKELEK